MANKLNNGEQRQLFFDSRSRITKRIVGENEKKSNWEKAFITFHFIFLVVFGFCIWYSRVAFCLF